AGGNDYIPTSGTLTFSPGVTSQTITVKVKGDTLVEDNENFLIHLSNSVNATILTATGIGTILDDDSTTISIGDVTVTEGDTGVTSAIFTVTLSRASQSTVSVDYATADDTANAGSDYVTASGKLLFAPGTTTQTISVLINGDRTFEN